MRGLTKIALAASLVASATASHAHNHRRLHQRDAPAVEKREVVTVVTYGPTKTVYELDGKLISDEQALEGIKNGDFSIVGETEPSAIKAEAVSTIKPSGGGFIELKATKSTASSTPSTTPTPTPTPTPSSKTSEAAKPTSTKASSTSSSSSGTGLDAEFPNGKIDCSEFPSDYGAIPVSWMGLGGWSGIQHCPNYSLGDLVIGLIETAVKGGGCTSNSFCSYACPPGYQKVQWPDAQGSTLESIGGLYCNSDGKLERTRDGYKTLCEPGVGGVTVQNDLDVDVSTCRTDYPGTENMVIPLLSEPGSSNPLTNPDSSTYYVWNDSNTTAQYYVNKAGYGLEDSCCWVSSLDPEGAGNFSPMNIGVGRDSSGKTYISIFRNLPSSDALLDFNIEITGTKVNGECSYIDGAFPDGGTGCTACMDEGGSATIRYFK
jgi:hypothetical protein